MAEPAIPLRQETLDDRVTRLDDRVTRLEEEKFSPGVDVRFALPIDDKRAIEFKTAFNQGLSALEQEKIITKILSVGSCIALAENLTFQKGELANAERLLRQLTEGDPEIEARRERATAKLNGAVNESAELRRLDEAKFRDSGRTGTYKPVGATASAISGHIKDIDAARAELEDIGKEIANRSENCRKAIENYKNVVLPNIEAQIAIRREAYGE